MLMPGYAVFNLLVTIYVTTCLTVNFLVSIFVTTCLTVKYFGEYLCHHLFDCLRWRFDCPGSSWSSTTLSCLQTDKIKLISKYVYFQLYEIMELFHLILLCNLCFCSRALCLANSILLLSVNDSELLCSFDAVDLSDEFAELKLVFSAVVGM